MSDFISRKLFRLFAMRRNWQWRVVAVFKLGWIQRPEGFCCIVLIIVMLMIHNITKRSLVLMGSPTLVNLMQKTLIKGQTLLLLMASPLYLAHLAAFTITLIVDALQIQKLPASEYR